MSGCKLYETAQATATNNLWRKEMRSRNPKTGGRPKIISKKWETGRKKGRPHRCQNVSTTLLHGDLDTPPQVYKCKWLIEWERVPVPPRVVTEPSLLRSSRRSRWLSVSVTSNLSSSTQHNPASQNTATCHLDHFSEYGSRAIFFSWILAGMQSKLFYDQRRLKFTFKSASLHCFIFLVSVKDFEHYMESFCKKYRYSIEEVPVGFKAV